MQCPLLAHCSSYAQLVAVQAAPQAIRPPEHAHGFVKGAQTPVPQLASLVQGAVG